MEMPILISGRTSFDPAEPLSTLLAVERGSASLEREAIASYPGRPIRVPKASGSSCRGSPITGV
jgi:hypothetical protein